LHLVGILFPHTKLNALQHNDFNVCSELPTRKFCKPCVAIISRGLVQWSSENTLQILLTATILRTISLLTSDTHVRIVTNNVLNPHRTGSKSYV